MGAHGLSAITIYTRGDGGPVYALACRVCDRVKPATATLMRSQVPGNEWTGAVWGFLLEHVYHGRMLEWADEPLPFPDS